MTEASLLSSELQVLLGFVSILAPIIAAYLKVNGAKVSNILTIAQKHLHTANAVTNNLGTTLNSIQEAMKDGKLTEAEIKNIAIQITATVTTLKEVANNRELSDKKII